MEVRQRQHQRGSRGVSAGLGLSSVRPHFPNPEIASERMATLAAGWNRPPADLNAVQTMPAWEGKVRARKVIRKYI